MAYNRLNILSRIIDIQNITIEHTSRGVTQKWVYDHVIYPRYFISLATFYNYLGVNARRELSRLKSAEAAQPTLF